MDSNLVKHPNLKAYLDKIHQEWIDEYHKDKINYCHEFIRKFIGDDFIHFTKSINTRFEKDIESDEELKTFINKKLISNSSEFSIFVKDGIQLVDERISELREISEDLRFSNKRKYFHQTDLAFDDLSYTDFSIELPLRIEIFPDYYCDYRDISNIKKDLSIKDGHAIQFLANHIKLFAESLDYIVDDHIYKNQQVKLCISDNFTICYKYNNYDLNSTNQPGDLYHILPSSRGMMDCRDSSIICDNRHRCIYIKCNQPLFDEETCKLANVYERLAVSYDNNDLVTQYNTSKTTEDKFFHNLLIKKLLLKNETINAVNEWLNNTKDRFYYYDGKNKDNIKGCYLDFYPNIRYDVGQLGLKLEIKEKLPKHIDLVYDSYIKLYINCFKYNRRVNESGQAYESRMNTDDADQYKSLETLMDNLNLKIDWLMIKIKKLFESYKLNNQQ